MGKPNVLSLIRDHGESYCQTAAEWSLNDIAKGVQVWPGIPLDKEKYKLECRQNFVFTD